MAYQLMSGEIPSGRAVAADAAEPVPVSSVPASIPSAEAQVAECLAFLKPGETPLQRIERDHRDILTMMKLLQREKEKNEKLVQTIREFCQHETSEAYRLRIGIVNLRDMLRRSRAVSNAHKREIDAELLRLLSVNNDPPQGIEARSDETPVGGSAEGESPVPEGNAP